MKVLLTGASGFLGSEIARQLVAAGHSLRVLVRKTSKLDGLKGLELEKLEGDVCDAASVERAIEGVDAVIHTAASVGARRRDRDTVYRTNVEGTRIVLGAAHKRGGLRVVHTSSIAAVGATAEPTLQDESSPWLVGGTGYHYVDSKKQSEDVALDFAKKGLDVIVLEPGMILGPGDVYFTSTRYVLEYLRGNLTRWTKGGISYCDVREVAKAHVDALTKGRAGERYIVAGQNHTYQEVQEALYRITGLWKPKPLPYAIAWFVALLSEVAALFAQHRFEEFNRPLVYYSSLWGYTSPAKAERELGYRVRPVEESLRDTVKDFLSRGLVEASTPELRAIAAAKAPAPAPALQVAL